MMIRHYLWQERHFKGNGSWAVSQNASTKKKKKVKIRKYNYFLWVRFCSYFCTIEYLEKLQEAC